jgi:glycosyltransferase involved in cell wall biosynthesis
VRVVFGPEAFGQRHGGVSRYFLELHQRLPALGVASTIFAGVHHNAYLPGGANVRGLRVPQRLQKERLRPARERLNGAFARVYLRAQRPLPIYHQTYYGGGVARRYDGPSVLTAYDLVHAKFPEHFPADDPTVALQREAFSRADLILAISHTTEQDLKEVFGVDPSRITVTPLGVSPPSDGASHSSAVRRPFLLYVGQRYGYKNWERFIRAYAASGLAPDVTVTCAGAPFTAAERDVIAKLDLLDLVVQVTADDSTLDALYRQALAFVYPSLYEGFGLPPLEAMARGCPVLASNAGAIPEVLKEGAVYADPTDPESLTTALREVVRPERREVLATLGRGIAATYSWDRTADLTAAAYRRLL